MSDFNRDQTASVLDLLRRAETYPDPTSKVEVIETHISWVFLTENFVYKLKKPVRFEFLDFSTVEQRRAACVDELNLNRRLAPDVYLDVVPITETEQGDLRLGGAGHALDWVVKMKRLPADRSLDRLLENKQLTEQDVSALGITLARFYGQQPALDVDSRAYLGGIAHHLSANSIELANPRYGFDTWLLNRLTCMQKRFLAVAQTMLAARIHDGKVIDGHGDLRPEHIFFDATPKIIDCLEFSQELRTIDIADELAFLAMECDRLGAPMLGQKILEIYCAATDDRIAPELVDFFKCYRACVRAKVNALRSQQVTDSAVSDLLETSNEYLQLADQSAKRLGPPILVVVRGLSGTGKSTVASAISESLGCSLLQTDEIRRERFATTVAEEAFNAGMHSPEKRQQVYETLFQRTDEHLTHGSSVVLDGTFLTAESRRRAIELARIHQAATLLVKCTCPDRVASQRITDRSRNQEVSSHARPEFVPLQKNAEEPDHATWPVCKVDTTQPLEQICETILDRIRPMIFPNCTNWRGIIACELSTRDDLATAEFVKGLDIRPHAP